MFISNIPLSVSPLAAQSAQSRGIVAAMKILMLFSVALECKIQLIGRSYSKTCFYFVASDIHLLTISTILVSIKLLFFCLLPLCYLSFVKKD